MLRQSTVNRIFLLAGLLVAACGGDRLGPNGERIVEVKDNSFGPNNLTVPVGRTVMWDWSGDAAHNVTWVVTPMSGNSPTQAAGTYTRQFMTPGTYDYFCTLHGNATTGMRGSVEVQ